MKTTKTPRTRKNGLRAGYRRSDFKKGFVRGKYAARLAAGSNVVVLSPRIAAAFPTSAAVNRALARLLIGKNSRPSPRTNGRR